MSTAATQPAQRTVSEKVIDLIGWSSSALEKAAADQEKQAAVQARVNELIPQVVKALLDNDRIEPHQVKQAADVLQDPVKALEVLLKVATHRNADEVARLGTSTGTVKTASTRGFNSLTSPHVGARVPAGQRASDLAFFRGLGLAPPAE